MWQRASGVHGGAQRAEGRSWLLGLASALSSADSERSLASALFSADGEPPSHSAGANGGVIATRWAMRARRWRLLRELRRALLLLLTRQQQRPHGGREASRKEPVSRGKPG